MNNFNFVDSAAKAYHFVWLNRENVMRMSAMALSIKILSFVIILVFGLEENILRQGLLLLPSHFFEGWVIAHILVMAVYPSNAARLPEQSTDLTANIRAGVIMYVLIKMVLSLITGLIFAGQSALPEGPPPAPSLEMLLVAGMLVAFMIWAFRFVWLYVPVMLGFTVRSFLMQFPSFTASFAMLAIWILCFVPLALLMLLLLDLINLAIIEDAPGAIGFAEQALKAGVQAVIDYALALVSSIGIAYGIMNVYQSRDS